MKGGVRTRTARELWKIEKYQTNPFLGYVGWWSFAGGGTEVIRVNPSESGLWR